MKTMKKLLALIMALTMVFALAATAFADSGNADDNTGKIVIQNPKAETDYNAYMLLKLVSYEDQTVDPAGNPGQNNDEGTHYVYTLAGNDWDAFFRDTSDDGGAKYVIIDDQGYVTWNTEENDYAAFAQLAMDWATDHSISADATGTTKDLDAVPDTLTLKKDDSEDLDLGWYLVDTSLGSLCSLGTTDDVAEIWEKNELVTGDKKAEDQDGGVNKTWAAGCTADVGEYVRYKVTIYCQDGAMNYCVHDTMDAGLKLVVDGTHPISVTHAAEGVAEENASTVAEANYTTYYGTDARPHTNDVPAEFKGKTHTLDVEIKDSYLKDLGTGDTIYVYYWAVVTADAIIQDGTNTLENNVVISYGDNNVTTNYSTKTTTFTFHVVKTNEENEALAGAEFVLYPASAYTFAQNGGDFTGTSITLIEGEVPEDSENEDDAYYIVCTDHSTLSGHEVTDHVENNTIVTNTKGKFAIQGLDQGTYYLYETKAPDGYNEMMFPVKVEIDEDGKVTFSMARKDASSGTWEFAEVEQDVAANASITVVNKSGKEMPATGGMGTTLFYVFGSIMAVGAAIVLVSKKRMSV